MNYKKIDSQDISYLKTAVSPDRVFTGEEISEDYGHDELGGVFSMPEVLIKVMDTGEVAAVMSYASEKQSRWLCAEPVPAWWEAPWPYMEESCWIQPP